MARLSFDIETDGLLEQLTKIHSLVLKDRDTGEGWSCTDHPNYTSPNGFTVTSIREGLRLLMEADEVIGHNIVKFDIPAIQKIHPWFEIDRSKIVDTLLQSRLIWPDIRERDFQLRNSRKDKLNAKYRRLRREWEDQIAKLDEDEAEPPEFPSQQDWVKEQLNYVLPARLIGSHGLEAWGWRLGEWKGDYSQEMKDAGLDPWASWNIEMQEYCEQDVTVTEKLIEKIDTKGYAPEAIAIERDFAVIIAGMEQNGFPFHMVRAKKLQGSLMRRHAEIKEQLKEAFPPITERWTFTPKASNSKHGYVKGVPMEKTKEVHFNPSSRQHIARWLKNKYGWKPKSYTDTGQPVVDEKVLKKLKFPEAKLLAEYFLLDKRLGMLEGKGGKGLIPHAFLHSDGIYRIHGGVNTNGAVTRRCTHSKPNMGQIPATSVPFGHEFRELLYAPDGWTLLGWDASGLELRCFAHYMAAYDGGAYREIVLSGDIHWAHVQALGLVEPGTERFDENGEEIEEHEKLRKIAKRFIYAFLYGAGAETIGEIVCPTGSPTQKKREGKKLIDTFLSRTPALARLKRDIAGAVKKRGKIKAIDGGTMHVRSDHAALNTLLQSAGAIAVKVATILFYDKLVAQGYRPGVDFKIVAHVHDEVQTLVRKGLEDVVGRTASEAMEDAGEALGFLCPLEAEYKPGASWAETH